MMSALGTPEVMLILAAILLLFGSKKLPEMMRGLGRGVKEYNDVRGENEAMLRK